MVIQVARLTTRLRSRLNTSQDLGADRSGQQAATDGVKEPKQRAATSPFLRAEGVKRLALDVPLKFIELVEARGLIPERVLAAFMADLAHTGDSNGSDERRIAEGWFDRVLWPEPASEAAVG